MAPEYVDLLDQVQGLQNLLVSQATGGSADGSEYVRLRKALLDDPLVGALLPRFVRTSRDLGQFWQFIKYKFSSYAERRQFLWDEFRPALEAAERGGSPVDESTTEILSRLNSDSVHAAWRRALERRGEDPEGAITLARSLLESVCKHVLAEMNQTYPDDADIPRLYRLVAEQLQLVPGQHTEEAFKRILGGCTSVVEGLGTLRNRLGDAHGTGPRKVKPASRHAELAVNLAGTMATFIVATWEVRKGKD
jgi:Abortive infection C-terminus